MTTDTSERGLERLICTALTGRPCDATLAQVDLDSEAAAAASGVGWICGDPNDYDREYTVDLAQLLAFLIEAQPDAFAGLHLEDDGPARRKFLARLQGEVSKRGVIDVFRTGVKDGPHHVARSGRDRTSINHPGSCHDERCGTDEGSHRFRTPLVAD